MRHIRNIEGYRERELIELEGIEVIDVFLVEFVGLVGYIRGVWFRDVLDVYK